MKDASTLAETRLIDAIEGISEGFALFDADDRLVLCNSKYKELYDYGDADVEPGTSLKELIELDIARGTIDEAAGAAEVLRRRTEIYGKTDETFDVALADGRWVQIRDRRTPDGDTVSIHADITERKRAEKDLIAAQEASDEAETRLTDAVSAISEGFVLYDANDNLVVCNEQMKGMYSTIADLLVPGANFFDLIDVAVERGQYTGTAEEIGKWKEERLKDFRNPSGEPYLTHLKDGRWVQTTDRRTREGGIAGIRNDVTQLKNDQEELARNSTALEATLANMDQGIAMFDADLKLLTWNRRFAVLRGIPEDILVSGIGYEDIVRSQAERGVYAAMTDVMGDDVEDQVRHWVDWINSIKTRSVDEQVLADGSVHEVSINPLTGGGYLATVTDITERKRAETEIARKEALLSTALTNMSDGIFVLDADMKMVMFNDRYANMLDIPPDTLEIGMPGRQFIDRLAKAGFYGPGDPEKLADARYAAIASDKHIEIEMTTPSGRILHVRKAPLKDGGAVGTVTDITERKRAEEALGESERQMSNTLEGSPIGVIITGPGDRVIFRNERWSELGGMAHGDIEDIDLDSIYVNPGDKQFLKDQLKGKDLVRDIEMEFKRSDGLPVWVLISMQRMMFGGEPVAISWVTDITERKQAEEALRESEGRFQSMLRDSPIGVAVVRSQDRKIIYANARLLEIFRIDEANLQSRVAGEYYADPDDRKWIAERLKRDGSVRDAEVRLKRRDDTEFWASVSFVPIEYVGEPARLAWFYDLTERKQAEEALRDSEARYETITANVPGVVYQRVMRPDGSISYPYVSPGVRALYEIEPDDILADAEVMLGVLPPDERERFFASLRESADTLDTWNLEFRVVTKSGAEKWIQGSSRVTRAEGGEVTWDGFLLDITERKRAEENLRIIEERHLLAMKAAAETSFTWDMVEDEIFLASREGGFFGLEPASVKCVTDWRKHVLPEDLDILNGAIIAHAKGLTERMECEYRIFDGEGKIRQVRQHSLAHRDAEGRATWLAGAIIDITDEVEAKEFLSAAKQAAEEASASKSEFLANMSHELRTPLNAIIGYSEILLEEADEKAEGTSASDLRKIQSAGRHLLSLINNVLDVSKIEAGKIEIFLETFDVAEMAHDVAATINPLAKQNDNAFEVHVPDDLGTMRSDITKVRQALFNLLSNACKFTEKGRITLDVSRHQVAPGEDLVFSVSDTGVGMTAEQCERVFDPFAQADSSTSRHFGGSGLGLAITRSFCQMLGGDITVTSEKDVGSTFVVRLAAAAPSALEDGGEVAALQTPPKPKGAATVLVVDDDPKVRDLLSRYLGRNGYHVRAAANGEEALSLAERLRPDAITLDVLMPGMDGWAVLGALKDNAELSEIPVIMLSIVDDRRIGFSLGAADYLIKPVDREKLMSTLRKHCPGNRRRVLVVEDDAPTREIMKSILKKEKWVVDEAENGLVGLRRVADAMPDVILLDLIMPEMDGFEFLSEIRANENWRGVPVIVVTAKTLTAKDRRQLEGRVMALLSKNAEDLVALPRILREIIHPPLDAAAPGARP
ncbi:MAG: PAS-domain containing protein [Rhodospirillales bacterium]|jgi:hypothetical protein|nr:PAS-domain containing protein [Rhodospirillales bacterium]MDP6773073.1 PAS-domain containing protein [Rhodospirillales bacterium]